MVYCGKPSPGCGRCRSRRLKCNQARPSCSQCIRANTDCPGYRDPLTLTFRDQSAEVVGKARKTVTTSKKKPAHCRTTSRDIPRPKATLSFPEDELARGFMFSNYLSGSPGSNKGYLAYMSSLAKEPQVWESAAGSALTAVGLATMSNMRMAPQLMLAARREYTTALSRTNAALMDPVLSKADDTLAAVVLLGMFEVTTCTDGSFFDRWMKHTDGAAKLIEMRGLEQLERPEGLHLFTQVRAQINISRVLQEIPTSPIITQLTEEAKKYRSPEDRMFDDFGTIGHKLADFCASIKDGTITHPTEIIRIALNLDAELTCMLLCLPISWHYRTVTVPQVDDGLPIPQAQTIWGNTYHVYGSISISYTWNNYRSARLILHEMIIEAATELEELFPYEISGEYTTLLIQSQQICHQLVEDIVATVPFHLGAAIDDNTYPARSTSEQGGNERASPASGLTLAWPLLVAANSGFASQELRRWIITVLDRVGYSMGHNQALAMAKLLRDRMRSRAWLDVDGSPASSISLLRH
ncbi:hypothetical protein BJX99DRAFT_238891 [Aspergillus californicus]